MKKLGWLASAVAASALLLGACGSTEEKEATNALEQVQKDGELTVGIMGTYAPYNYMGSDNEYTGFDVEIAEEVAKRLDVKAKFVAQDFSGLIPGLQKGKFDILVSQVTITDERKEQVNFTEPYITNNVKIIVKEDNNTIKTAEDFKGKTVGVGLGTNDETYLRTDLMEQVGKFKINTYDDVVTTLKDLDAGRIDATINNAYALQPVVEKNGYKIKTVGEALKSDKAAIAVAKGEDELTDEINTALDAMEKDGTYTEIFEKWFNEKPSAEYTK